MSEVPCDGCTKCCSGDAIRILSEDAGKDYVTVPHAFMPNERMLDHKPNGDCYYLTESGCSIHDDKPHVCRTMDCRHLARAITFTQARKYSKRGVMNIQVWKRGKELLKKHG